MCKNIDITCCKIQSVVTKNVPPWTVVAGNPAKVVKYIKCND